MALETRAVASRGPPRAVVKSVTSETTTQSLNRCCITRILFSSTPALENTDHEQEPNTVLLNCTAGPIRIEAETLENQSVPNVMHNSDNDDEGYKTKILRPSKTVPAYLLGTSNL